ncbi:MAG: hypothetical protein EOO11_11305 [Chitinophagaceae bacterium]|nr:MAG: hypothetical protein EOO11_11305 [Chitinophagaceae bacterium]
MSSSSNRNAGRQGNDGTDTRNKGERQQTQHQGAPSVSKKGQEPHRKDESEGASRNTTKKGPNSI